MQAAVILAQLALQLLPTMRIAVQETMAWITSVRAAAQQTGEWPEEAEKAYRESLIVLGQSPAAQPDPAPPTP